MPVNSLRKQVVTEIVRELPSDAGARQHSESEAYPEPERAVTVLAVSPFDEDHVFLQNLFSHSNWHIRGVGCWSDGLRHLSRNRVAVVICESQVGDANWQEVLKDLALHPDQPLLVVCSRLADDALWAEVLNLGGYDMLMKPFDATEVVRVISLAWLNWKNSRDRARRLAAPNLSAAAGM